MTKTSTSWSRSQATEIDAAGFTLVEVLIALTLVAFIAVLAFGGVRLGTRAWQKSEDITAQTDEVFAAQALLQRQIRQSYPAYINTSQNVPHVDFAGHKERLTILTPAPEQLALGGFARMNMQLQERGADKDFMVQSYLDLGPSTGDDRRPPVVTGVLARDVRSVRFGYYGSIRSGSTAAWHETWSVQPALPDLVKIEVVFRDPGKYWPPLIIPLRVDVDAGCIFDAVSRHCRGR